MSLETLQCSTIVVLLNSFHNRLIVASFSFFYISAKMSMLCMVKENEFILSTEKFPSLLRRLKKRF